MATLLLLMVGTLIAVFYMVKALEKKPQNQPAENKQEEGTSGS